MSAGATTPKLPYVVYIPYGHGAFCYPFYLPEGAEVADLVNKIRISGLESRLEGQEPILLKCGDEKMEPTDTLYKRVSEWLRERERPRMHPARRLKYYFPDGPAAESEEKIDVLVVTDDILRTIRRPTTPENQKSIPFVGTQRNTQLQTEQLVDKFLSGHDTRLREYLAARFIDKIKIPEVLGSPVLLLHDLKDGIVDERVVDKVFDRQRRLLVNTSGSGKTRLLLEGLSKRWGFYFTSSVGGVTNPLGSTDLARTVSNDIPESINFWECPETLDERLRSSAYRHNHYIAERRMFQVIKARMLLFKYFWDAIKKMSPSRDVDDFKVHWLFLQLRPFDILREDVFRCLVDILKDAEDDYLKVRHVNGLDRELYGLLGEEDAKSQFVIVLDEAQVLSEKLTKVFRSDQDHSVNRPVLRPIIDALMTASDLPIIISGTGLSIELANEVHNPAPGKLAAFGLATETGAFVNPEQQRNYIKCYMPEHVVESESGEELLERAWRWVRRRHRFTASLLDQLLVSSFQVPHKTLNAYVKVFSGFTPSDGQCFVEEEKTDIKALPWSIVSLRLSKVCNNPVHIAFFSDLLSEWLMHQTLLPLTERKKELVQLGFARFSDDRGNKAVVDEPLAILAATAELGSISGFLLGDIMKQKLLHTEGRDKNFENFIGFYFASAFGDGLDLCDIFDFGEAVPQWAKQGVELVSISREGAQVKAYPYHLPGRVGATLCIGKKCSDVKETLKWFREPSTVLCFLDRLMGPDVVLFVRLACGLIMAVLVQNKWRSKDDLTLGDLTQAVPTLEPSKFYSHKNLKDAEYKTTRSAIQGIIKSLNEGCQYTETDGWFEDALPALKVIASFPTVAPKNMPARYVSLDMERCLRSVDKDHMLKTIALSLGMSVVQGDASEPPAKKRRF